MATTPQRAWVTLLTRSSYLPGVILLAHSLRRVKSAYPLIVLVTESLSPDSMTALKEIELEVRRVEPLRPKTTVSVVAERFADTWDKLRVFGLEGYEVSYTYYAYTLVVLMLSPDGGSPGWRYACPAKHG